MIASLADAWNWYESTRNLALAMQRLGQKHWDALSWEGPLGRDERLRHLDADDIAAQTTTILDDLNDLCVLLLFSVFEASVRAQVLRDLEKELPGLQHPTLRHAVAELKDAVEQGSFFRLLEPYKIGDADLVEEVNQVRRYRNWVAHGRRGASPFVVNPESAYNRLERFLSLLVTVKPS